MAERHFCNNSSIDNAALKQDLETFFGNLRIYRRLVDDVLKTYSNVNSRIASKIGHSPNIENILAYIADERQSDIAIEMLGEIRQAEKLPFTDYKVINEFITLKEPIPSDGVPINLTGAYFRYISTPDKNQVSGIGVGIDLMITTDLYEHILERSDETCGVSMELSKYLNDGKPQWDYASHNPFILPDTPYLIRTIISKNKPTIDAKEFNEL